MKIGALDDLECPGADLGDGVGRLLALAAVGEDAFDEREQASRPAQQWNGSVTILDIAGSDEDVQQEAEGIDQNVAPAAQRLLPGIIARRVERGPPFEAPRAV